MCTDRHIAPPRGRHAGFTLVELIMFIVIVSVALAGILSVMNITTAHSADPQVRKQALSIAEALMEEVTLAKFTYCDPADPAAQTASSAADCQSVPEGVGPEPGNVRPYDNVNDYVSAYGVAQPIAITDVNGVNPGLAAYTATITIDQQSLNGVPATDSLRITINVSYNNTPMISLQGYRTRYAPDVVP